MTNEVIVKTVEQRQGVRVRIFQDNQYKMLDVPFKNYFYVKTIDLDRVEDVFNSALKYAVENTISIGIFTKIIFTDNFFRNKVKMFFDDNNIQTFEADIKANKRWLLMHPKLPLNNEQIPYCFIDIETDDRGDLKKDENGIVIAQSPILSYARTDWKGEQTFQTLTADDEQSEITLLNYILNDLARYGFVSGWYSEGFDMPYIKQRCLKYGISIDILEYINHIDYLELYKKFSKKTLKSYSLDSVSEYELKKNKIEQGKGHGQVYDTWKNNLQHLLKYNLEDSNLIYELNKKLSFVEICARMANDGHCDLRSTFNDSDIGDYLLLKEAYALGHISVSKPNEKEKAFRKSLGKIGGGYTTCFKPGLHKSVKVWDFKSFYPSIMMTFNVGPDTFVRNMQHDEYLKVKDTFDYSKYIITPDDTNDDVRGTTYHPHRVYLRQKSLFGVVCSKLMIRRDSIKYSMAQHEETDPDMYKKLYQEQYGIKTEMNCFHPNTMILTKEGVKNIKDIQLNEEVLSLNPKTLNTEWKKVIALHDEHYKGDLIKFENTRTKIRTTPNHKFFLYDKINKIHNFREIGKLSNTQRYQIPVSKFDEDKTKYIYLHEIIDIDFSKTHIMIRMNGHLDQFNKRLTRYGVKAFKYGSTTKKDGYKYCYINDFSKIKVLTEAGFELFLSEQYGKIPVRYLNSDLSALVGWFISEGHHSKHSFRLTISQLKEDNRILIDDLFKRLSITYHKNNHCFHFNSNIFYNWFINDFGRDSYEKDFPLRYFLIFHLKDFYNALDLGDGTVKQGRYTTKSKKLAEKVLILLNMFGYRTRLHLDKSNSYRIGFNKKSLGEYHSLTDSLCKERYDGTVYNLTVEDNHTLLAAEYKDNGNLGLVWTSQSLYGVMSFANSRWYLYDAGDTVTTCARHIIKQCRDRLNEWGCEGIGGDTDSQFAILGENINLRTIDVNFIGYINDFAQQWHLEEHYIVFEYEKKYEPFLFIKKKNYAGLEYEYIGNKVLDKVPLDQREYNEKEQFWYFKKGKLKIKGLEAIKSDVNKVASKLQKELIQDILYSTYDEQKWAESIKTLYNRVITGKLDAGELILVKALTKKPEDYSGPMISKKTGKPKIKADGTIQQKSIPAHVKLAKRLMTEGKDIHIGDKIKYIVVDVKPIVAVTPEEYKGHYIEQYYWTRIIKPTAKVLFTVNKSLPEFITKDLSRKDRESILGDDDEE